MHGHDLPSSVHLFQHACGDAESFGGLAGSWLDSVTVGLGRKGNRPFEADVDLVVGEAERFELPQLGTKMMGEVGGVGSFRASCLEDPRVNRKQFFGSSDVKLLDRVFVP